MFTDPIADFLTRVRNASKARLKKVDVNASQMKVSLAEIWKETGYIKNFNLYRQGNKGVLRLYLKYHGKNQPVIQGIVRISKPGRRVYARCEKIPKILNGMGVSIVSTSKGIMTDSLARESRVGGEVICKIW